MFARCILAWLDIDASCPLCKVVVDAVLWNEKVIVIERKKQRVPDDEIFLQVDHELCTSLRSTLAFFFGFFVASQRCV